MLLLKRMAKKGVGTLMLLWSAALVIVSLAIMYGLSSNILVDLQTSAGGLAVENTSVAYNASAHGLTSIHTFSQWNPTLAIIVIAVVIIGLISLFGVARRMRGGY